MPDQPAEVLAEEPRHEGEREEHRGQDRQLLDGGVLPHADLRLLHRDHRHVRLEHRAEQVPLGGDLLVDQEQVVPDVPQVRLQLRGLGRLLDGVHHGEQRVDRAVEVGGLAAQRVDPLGRRDGAGEHGGLDLVDVAFEPGDDGRVVVHHLIQDRPERG